MELHHIHALLRFHHHTDWTDLIDQGADGELDFTRYANVVNGLLWVLAHREF